MDYFAKFKRGTGPNTSTIPKSKPNPVMQLAKFHKCWNYVHNLYFIEDKKAQINVKQTPIPQYLRTMADILVNEEIYLPEGQTGICMEYLLKNNVLNILVNIAQSDFPKGVRGEVMRCVANMINLLDNKFLVHTAVFKPTLKLIRMGAECDEKDLYHEDLMELMYVICSKIHGYPDLLNIFFHDRTWMRTPQRKKVTAKQWVEIMKKNAAADSPTGTTRRRVVSPAKIAAAAGIPLTHQRTDSQASLLSIQQSIKGSVYDDVSDAQALPLPAEVTPDMTITPKPDYEFQLFSYLLRYVHREGKTGDYARTAILFIIELATGELGDYLLQSSSFPAVTAAGIGALYSQLPHSYSDDVLESEAEITRLSRNLDALAKGLEFCQDVLDRCPLPAISQALLANLRRVLLENMIWPNLTHSYESDGTAEATITHLDVILRNLRQPDMIDLVLSYLGLPLDTEMEDEEDGKLGEDGGSAKHIDENAMDIDRPVVENRPADGFNLTDLILKLLSSESERIIQTTLHLVETLLTVHCGRSRRLVGGKPLKRMTPHHVEDHRRELDLYMSAMAMLNPDVTREETGFGEDYSRYLVDADHAIETHRHIHDARNCTFQRYRIDPEAPLPQALNRLLSNFYRNSHQLNLALSGVIAALAHCQYRDIDGWMACLSSPNSTRRHRRQEPRRQRRRRLPSLVTSESFDLPFGDEDDMLASDDSASTALDEDDTEETETTETTTEDDPTDTETLASRDSIAGAKGMRHNTPGVAPPPALYCTLELLTNHVAGLRMRHPDFDTYMRERRKHFDEAELPMVPQRIDDVTGRYVSDLVNATTMLEEMCKEWLSLVQVRRGVGLDPVAFY